MGNPTRDLPGAEKETEAIASTWPDARVVNRSLATETLFKKVSPGFDYIHLAMHGVFNSSRPMTSGLFFAEDPENDGILTVGELYELKLDAVLVTLSACSTGLGKVVSGDDVVGLYRGFLYAGAESIVSSLWNVNDEATEVLMDRFYSGLGAGMSRRDALQAAQISLKRSIAPSPYFWAAFQLIGAAD